MGVAGRLGLGWRDAAVADAAWLVIKVASKHEHGTSARVLPADPGGELGSRGEPELVEDVLDVRIDRSLGEHQVFGDLTVPQALGHQFGDLSLSLGQRGGDLADRGRRLVSGPRARLA